MLAIQSREVIAGRQVRSEMPSLRRFGRELTGDQGTADVSVVQLMNDIIEGTDFIDSSHNPRVAIYRRFLSILESAFEDSSVHPSTTLPTPRTRQGYLLTAIEGFSDEAAAEVLSVSLPEFRLLLDTAKEQVGQQHGSDVLIIEDEVFISLDLATIVGELGHNVIGCARTHKEAIAAIGRSLPDLILSDIQLADGSSGIEAVDEILAGADAPVIFITAYPERLLTGKRGEPAFVIAKPFDTSAVRATISQALYLRQHRASASNS